MQQIFDMALGYHQAGRFQEAEQLYRRLLAEYPNHADALHLLGLLGHQSGRNDMAVENIRRAISLNPQSEIYHLNLGGVYLGTGRLDEAIGTFQQSLRLKPGFAPACYNLGIALRLRGRLEESLAVCREAVRLNPTNAEVYNSLGATLQALDQLAEAQAHFEHAVRLSPQMADGYFNLGNVLRLQGRYDEAVPYCEQAVRMQPQSAKALGNLGVALHGQGRSDEAIALLREALRLDPRAIEPRSNLATALRQRGFYDEAAAESRTTLQQDPNFGPAHLNLAFIHLVQGDFARGWEEYEWRPELRSLASRPFGALRWDGSPLAGKTILVYDEQGLGDSLQFARFIPVLERMGGRVVVECHAPLVRLFQKQPAIAEVIARGDPLPRFDVHVPLLSVAGLLGTTLATIPAEVPYLSVEASLVEEWRERLAGPGFKVGLVWQGSPHHQGDRYRSFSLELLASRLAVPGVRFYSLQKGAGREQLARVADKLAIEDLAPQLHDLLDTAAAMQHLDLVVSCDSAPVHLAGALGLPAWVALHSADWRWLLEREDSPWYRSLRLWRQRQFGQWDEVFERMASELASRAAAHGAHGSV